MAITLEMLQGRLREAGVQYFVAPDRPVLMMGFAGAFGSYQVVALVELEGRFVQFRTVGYLKCPIDHPNLTAVLRVIGDLDYRLRLTKFGWDPSDGEIVGYADLWLEDTVLTQPQFLAVLRTYVGGIDVGHQRIATTIETGRDPLDSGIGTSGGTTGPGGSTQDPTRI